MVIIKAPVPLDVRARVKLRDGNRCVACHARDRLTIDHIVPRCRGGGNDEENLQLLCEYCNGAKADSVIDFRSMQREQREEWVKHEGSTRLRRRAESKRSADAPPTKPETLLPRHRSTRTKTKVKPTLVYDYATDTWVWKKTLTKQCA